MLEIQGLSVSYGPFLALDLVSIGVRRGEIVGLVGPNGAGKSSLVKALGGLVTAMHGAITFGGSELRGLPAHTRSGMGLSIVPEGRGLFTRMSIEENLLMGLYNERSPDVRAIRLERAFALFPMLKDRRRQLAGTMSGGQQQMLAVAVGLMSEPTLIVLDEPSLGLAPIVIQEIGRALKQMRSDGLTVLLVEQNARLTCDVAYRIYIMQAGRIRHHGTPEKLFSDPEVVTSYLGG